jgi:proteasome lid subunit RPN8/RPN11
MKIKKSIIEAIITQAKKDAPIEACGYLASQGKVVIKHYELSNVDKSSEHFSFDPQDQFKVAKEARSCDLDIIAVYHSHPQSPAYPSAEDIKLAYDPDISYVIVSLLEAKEEVKSFKIKNSKVFPEKLEVI